MHSPTSTDAVREMFNRISPTYDLLNFLLSCGVHNVWARKAVLSVEGVPEGVCLDLCTGTGALVPMLAKRFNRVVAADISPGMLELGRKNHAAIPNCTWVEANALDLPFLNDEFDVATVAYGVRNWPDPSKGLSEVQRVTKPGGKIVVLEFGQPRNSVWRAIFGWYSRWVIPCLGSAISGDKDAYRYLPETSAAFPCREAFTELLSRQGWRNSRYSPLMGGIAYIYVAEK